MRKRAERDRAVRARWEVEDAGETTCTGRSAPPPRRTADTLQAPRLSGHPDKMVLNAAYLVDATASAAFRTAIVGWRSPYVHIELTDPWAPYSFASLEDP